MDPQFVVTNDYLSKSAGLSRFAGVTSIIGIATSLEDAQRLTADYYQANFRGEEPEEPNWTSLQPTDELASICEWSTDLGTFNILPIVPNEPFRTRIT